MGTDRFAERRGRVDRDDLDLREPLDGPRRQPRADAGTAAPVHDAQHLPSSDVHDGGHPRLVPRPGAGFRPVEPHASVPMFIDAQSLDGHRADRRQQQRGRGHRALDHHHDAP